MEVGEAPPSCGRRRRPGGARQRLQRVGRGCPAQAGVRGPAHWRGTLQRRGSSPSPCSCGLQMVAENEGGAAEALLLGQAQNSQAQIVVQPGSLPAAPGPFPQPTLRQLPALGSGSRRGKALGPPGVLAVASACGAWCAAPLPNPSLSPCHLHLSSSVCLTSTAGLHGGQHGGCAGQRRFLQASGARQAQTTSGGRASSCSGLTLSPSECSSDRFVTPQGTNSGAGADVVSNSGRRGPHAADRRRRLAAPSAALPWRASARPCGAFATKQTCLLTLLPCCVRVRQCPLVSERTWTLIVLQPACTPPTKRLACMHSTH